MSKLKLEQSSNDSNRNLILISGKVGVGKDTFADCVEKYFESQQMGVYRQSMAGILKSVCVDLINIFVESGDTMTLEKLEGLKDSSEEYVKTKNMREILYSVSLILKQRIPNLWVKIFMENWEKGKVGVVPDVRFDELEAFIRLTESEDVVIHHIIVEGEVRNRDYSEVGNGVQTVKRVESSKIYKNSHETIEEMESGVKVFMDNLLLKKTEV